MFNFLNFGGKLPRPPLKIPLPLDKAGYKIDVTFEINSLTKNLPYFTNKIGLRISFAPGTDEVYRALTNPPLVLRIFLYRLENGQQLKIPLTKGREITKMGEYPPRFEVYEIPEDKATASLDVAEHSGAPLGTPNASTFVMGLAAAGSKVTQGVYRFQVETLDNIPELSGVPSFFVYEDHRKG